MKSNLLKITIMEVMTLEGTLQIILDFQTKLANSVDQLTKGQKKIFERLDRLEGNLEKSYVENQRDIIAILERTATKDDVEKILEKIVI